MWPGPAIQLLIAVIWHLVHYLLNDEILDPNLNSVGKVILDPFHSLFCLVPYGHKISADASNTVFFCSFPSILIEIFKFSGSENLIKSSIRNAHI